MLYEEVRRDVAEGARQMVLRGLSHMTSGNVTARAGEGLFAVTPTGMDHASLTPEDIVIINAAEEVIDGRRKPTSEVPMHLSVYKARPDVGGIFHTHSDMATTFAVLGEDLPAVHYILAFAGKKVRCAPYATYGSRDLAAYALDALGDSNAVLLGNHGVLAVGPTLGVALSVAEAVEITAGFYYRARCVGMPKVLSDEEMARVITAFSTYGQPEEKAAKPAAEDETARVVREVAAPMEPAR
jgi:L-fuculose-phosphate aldolase